MKTELLLSADNAFFTTRQYALANNLLFPSASRTLNRLAENGTIRRVTKGVWANPKHPYFNPLGCVPLLLRTEQGYVSFLTALHRHGAISQIPPNIQVATTGRGRKLKTPIGTFEFIQLNPGLMTEGIDWSEGKAQYRIASAEKALLDTVYVSTRKGRRFASLPELDERPDPKEVLRLAKKQLPKGIIRDAVLSRLAGLGITEPKARKPAMRRRK